jgi:proteasome accessory factor A
MNRIVGLETEYGCLTSTPAGSFIAVERVRDWIFGREEYGLIDVHHRDWDEPPGNGGFLFNGGRVYIDMGHLEYCTPECTALLDILRYDRAGDALALRAVKALGLGGEVSFIRNNIDHYTGATFGCHENYLVRRSAPLTETNVLSLLTFLTLRLLFTGAGRVGTTLAAEWRGDVSRPGIDGVFQMSQRADYINNDLYEWVQFNRSIINTRDEPLGDPRKYRRLHLLHGDTSVLPATLLLKVGTTSLMLDLLEINHLPRVVLADAVKTFRALSHQPQGPWETRLADGRPADAVELLERFFRAAWADFHGRDTETDILLDVWGSTLKALATEPQALIGKVDWITKQWLLQKFLEQEKLEWEDPWLKAQDLEFHHIDPARSLGQAMSQPPPAWDLSARDIEAAVMQPPANTRAHARSDIMRMLRQHAPPYSIDWEIVGVEGLNPLNLLDPFDPSPPELKAWFAEFNAALKGTTGFPRTTRRDGGVR